MDTVWISTMKKLEQKEMENDNKQFRQNNNDDDYTYQYDRSKNNYDNQSKQELFFFDPNTISTNEWKKLGLRDKTIRTIQNYLGKGGRFKKSEDFSKDLRFTY